MVRTGNAHNLFTNPYFFIIIPSVVRTGSIVTYQTDSHLTLKHEKSFGISACDKFPGVPFVQGTVSFLTAKAPMAGPP